uniref:Mitochondrial proton/calcium exchanger protein n=1 Tax=Clastoptera arizonana TaxID=38151 RepID=A0A1B6CH06_9HEMI
MYSVFSKYSSCISLKTGQIIKAKCKCKNHMIQFQKLNRFSSSNGIHFSAYRSVHVSETNYLTSNKNKYFKDSNSLHSLRSYNSNILGIRNIHFTNGLYVPEPNKPSSKVEESVEALKEKAKAKENVVPAVKSESVVPVKKSFKQKAIDVILHYYHGFRLLSIDIRISTGLVWRILNGKTLTRREYKLLIRTVGDMFRLVPFSVFIIVPFMELLLPLFIKFFPGMLPSTFQSATEKEDKIKQSLKVKLEMAKFLQHTLDDMAVTGKGHSSQSAKEFVEFFEKIRKTGTIATNEEIMKFSKLFQDEITLDSLSRLQLMALCKVLELQPFGTKQFLRFQLKLKLRSLAADDNMIKKEGLDALSPSELQQACRARGMRALGMSEERLKAQLEQWLDLSLNKKVPPSLLLLSRAFMLPETTTTTEKLKATISALPETVATKTKAAIGELEGKVDNKTKIEIIKEEVAKIKEERMEEKEESERLAKEEAKDKDLLVDKAPILEDKAEMLHSTLKAAPTDKPTAPPAADKPKEKGISTKDLELLEDALDSVGKDKKKLLVEKEELDDLKEEMADYEKDVANLKEVNRIAGPSKTDTVKESTAAKRLSRTVTKMITKVDQALLDLEKKEKAKKEDLLHKDESVQTSDELLRIEELILAIQNIRKDNDPSKLNQLTEVLGKIDADRDGVVKVDDVRKVIEFIVGENVELSKKQVEEIIDLVVKEEAMEKEKKDDLANQEKMSKDKKENEPPSNPPSEANDTKIHLEKKAGNESKI